MQINYNGDVQIAEGVRLSEAVRQGALISEPCQSRFYNVAEDDKIFTCALGAACLHVGILEFDASIPKRHAHRPPNVGGLWFHEELKKAFGLSDSTYSQCPTGGVCLVWEEFYSDKNILQAIIHLNDGHSWPREQIADWLEKQGL